MYTAENDTFKLTIQHDDSAESPREWDNDSTFLTWEARHQSPDTNPYATPEAFLDAIQGDESTLVLLPVYRYEHSGVAYSTTPFTSTFDSGQIGYIYADKKDHPDATDEQIQNTLKADVAIYSDWANGETWSFILEEKSVCDCCDRVSHTIVDSCAGFVGADITTNGVLANIPGIIDEKDTTALIADITKQF